MRDLAVEAVGAASCDGVTGETTQPVAVAPLPVPPCATTVSTRPYFNDGPALQWVDAVTGETRAACVYKPVSAQLLPLVVALHQHGHSANWVYDSTLLRNKAPRVPFALISDQGRVLDSSNGPVTSHAMYYRQPDNADYRAIDGLIDAAVAQGGIDPKRIYVIGWSEGGFFAQEYAILRHVTATPGGNRIAAAAVYASADPFENVSATQSPSCAAQPLPATSLPIYVIHRTCDSLVACDYDQWKAFGLPPGFNVNGWVASLKTTMGDANVRVVLIDSSGLAASACAAASACSASLGAAQHAAWPDGINDGSGHDWEPELLSFLLKHTL